MSSYITVNGSYGNTAGSQGPRGDPGPPGLLDLPYPDVLTLTPQAPTNPNFVITDTTGATNLLEFTANDGTGVPVLNMPTGEIICDTITADTLNFTDEQVQKLTIEGGTSNDNVFQIAGNAVVGGPSCFTVNNTGSVSINPVVDGTVFTIQDVAAKVGLVYRTDVQRLILSGGINSNLAVIQNCLVQPGTDGLAFIVANAAGTNQLTFNTSTNTLTSTGTIQSATLTANGLTINPSTDGQVLFITNAAGSTILNVDTSKPVLNFLTNYFFGSNTVFPNSSNIAFNYFSDSAGNDNYPNTTLGSSLIGLESNQISLFTGNPGTRPSTGLIFNGTNLFPTNTNQVNLGLTSNSFGTVNCARVAAWNSISAPTISTGTLSIQNLSINPGTDGQVIEVQNVAKATILNFNTSTNQLTLTGNISANNITCSEVNVSSLITAVAGFS